MATATTEAPPQFDLSSAVPETDDGKAISALPAFDLNSAVPEDSIQNAQPQNNVPEQEREGLLNPSPLSQFVRGFIKNVGKGGIEQFKEADYAYSHPNETPEQAEKNLDKEEVAKGVMGQLAPSFNVALAAFAPEMSPKAWATLGTFMMADTTRQAIQRIILPNATPTAKDVLDLVSFPIEGGLSHEAVTGIGDMISKAFTIKGVSPTIDLSPDLLKLFAEPQVTEKPAEAQHPAIENFENEGGLVLNKLGITPEHYNASQATGMPVRVPITSLFNLEPDEAKQIADAESGQEQGIEPKEGEQGQTFYHGTNAKFDQFLKPEDVPEEFKDPYSKTFGTYFTPNKELAGKFGKNIVEANLNIKKPLDLTNVKSFDDLVNSLPIDKDKNSITLQNMVSDSFYDKLLPTDSFYKPLESLIHKFNLMPKIKALGYDGIIFNDSENGIKGVTHVAFEPSQINIKQGVENANQRGESTQSGSGEETPQGQAQAGVHLRDNEEGGVEAKAGEEVTGEKGTSKIAKSIEQKAKDAGMTEGLDKLSEFDKATFKEQRELGDKTVQGNLDDARAMIRGEKPLPDGLRGIALIDAMERHIKTLPDGDLKDELVQELGSSKLVSETSTHAQETALAGMREPDSFTAKMNEINRAKVEAAGGDKEVSKATKKSLDTYKKESSKVNLSKDELNWDKFLDGIKC